MQVNVICFVFYSFFIRGLPLGSLEFVAYEARKKNIPIYYIYGVTDYKNVKMIIWPRLFNTSLLLNLVASSNSDITRSLNFESEWPGKVNQRR